MLEGTGLVKGKESLTCIIFSASEVAVPLRNNFSHVWKACENLYGKTLVVFCIQITVFSVQIFLLLNWEGI